DLAWNAVKGAAGYRLRIGTDAKFKSPTYLDVPTNAALASALASLQQYYVSVHAIDAKGAALSPESTILAAKTDAAPPAPQLQIPEYDIPGTLNVGTYNVFCANCTKSTSEQKPWTERKQLVIDNILNEDLDVVGLQEASQGWLKDANGKKYDKSQFEDLVEGLGANWAVTNNNRYNCANPKKSTNCVYTYQGASGGDRIAYRTDRLALLTAGSIQLPELDASYTDRFFTWATFTQLSTGKQFFFGDTHLEPQKETKAPWTFYNLRQESTQLILDTIAANNPAGLPVILTGDLQGHKNSKPDNGPYNLLTANGLIDPLGNVKGDTPVNATVITRINTQYNSYNSFQRTALKQKGVNGQNFDYILTTAMTVLEYETVVNVDKDGKYVGVFPSDHNLLRARLLLP
ncbi:MAG: endonuclease/exonuclease/phosphatase family protein, partial [Propionibacteriaceae bacterium]|nr:endonuclease/exonuclease/phosphatase family protein [Propionibacteriaceae bacterium]